MQYHGMNAVLVLQCLSHLHWVSVSDTSQHVSATFNYKLFVISTYFVWICAKKHVVHAGNTLHFSPFLHLISEKFSRKFCLWPRNNVRNKIDLDQLPWFAPSKLHRVSERTWSRSISLPSQLCPGLTRPKPPLKVSYVSSDSEVNSAEISIYQGQMKKKKKKKKGLVSQTSAKNAKWYAFFFFFFLFNKWAMRNVGNLFYSALVCLFVCFFCFVLFCFVLFFSLLCNQVFILFPDN